MSLIALVRRLVGIVALAFAPTWDKDLAEGVAAVEATLAQRYGDVARGLCENLVSSTLSGPEKLFDVAGGIVALAVKDGIAADVAIIKTIAVSVAQKAYVQIRANAVTDVTTLAHALLDAQPATAG